MALARIYNADHGITVRLCIGCAATTAFREFSNLLISDSRAKVFTDTEESKHWKIRDRMDM